MVSFLCKTWCPSQCFVFQFVVSISWIFVVCHAVKLQKVDVFNPVIGGYDKLAIAFGYTPIKELLQRLFVEKDQDKRTVLVGRPAWQMPQTSCTFSYVFAKKQNVYKLAERFGKMIIKYFLAPATGATKPRWRTCGHQGLLQIYKWSWKKQRLSRHESIEYTVNMAFFLWTSKKPHFPLMTRYCNMCWRSVPQQKCVNSFELSNVASCAMSLHDCPLLWFAHRGTRSSPGV